MGIMASLQDALGTKENFEACLRCGTIHPTPTLFKCSQCGAVCCTQQVWEERGIIGPAQPGINAPAKPKYPVSVAAQLGAAQPGNSMWHEVFDPDSYGKKSILNQRCGPMTAWQVLDQSDDVNSN